MVRISNYRQGGGAKFSSVTPELLKNRGQDSGVRIQETAGAGSRRKKRWGPRKNILRVESEQMVRIGNYRRDRKAEGRIQESKRCS
jgi:hypothetical protein